MADLTNGSGVYQTYNNAGTGVAELGDNKAAATHANGIAGRTVIVSAVGTSGNDLLQSELDELVFGLGKAGGDGTGSDIGGPDAFTVVGIDGTVNDTNAMYLALQGTGTVSTGAGAYATNVTLTVVADFPGISG